MSKSKRDEAEEAKGDYEFVLPDFDEKAFVRREVQSAKLSFWTIGLGLLAGVLATLVWAFTPHAQWYYGWIPLALSLVVLRPLLQRLEFEDDLLAPRALFGSYFMLLFTGLAIWVLGVNFVP